MSNIAHATIPVGDLSPHQREQMHQLMDTYYLGVTREQFEHDLGEKEQAICLLQGADGARIAGFSTLMRLDLEVSGKVVKAIFSGDTIVDRGSRATLGLGLELTRYFVQTLEEYPHMELYYILIAKGWQTCRIPAALFHEFSPSQSQPAIPRHKQVMDAFGAKKYPCNYQPETGLIVYSGHTQRVIPGSPEGSIPPRNDPQVEHFVKTNPNYLRGDELVYVAPVRPENFTRVFRRLCPRPCHMETLPVQEGYLVG